MQSISSRIWTRITVSIACDNNHYTTGTKAKCEANICHLFTFQDKNFRIIYKIQEQRLCLYNELNEAL